jgi:PAS domain-containing protein
MKGGREIELNKCGDSYSPASCLERLSGRKQRAAQFGLNDRREESFECNQSFPRAAAQHCHSPPVLDVTRLRVREPNSINFLKRRLALRGPIDVTSDNISIRTPNDTNIACVAAAMDKSWALYNHIMGSHSSLSYLNESAIKNANALSTVNPNKALMTINARTSEILTANDISCDLFGYNECELIGKRLRDLLEISSDEKTSPSNNFNLLMESDRLDENGRVVLCSGRIVNAITVETLSSLTLNEFENNNSKQCARIRRLLMPISIYMLKLTDEAEPRCLCVMEPVQSIIGQFSINIKVILEGKFKFLRNNFKLLFYFNFLFQTV